MSRVVILVEMDDRSPAPELPAAGVGPGLRRPSPAALGAESGMLTVSAKLTSRSGKLYNIEVVVQRAGFKQAQRAETYSVARSYREFEELDGRVRRSFPNLPPLPGRSFWRKNLLPGFLEARERALSDFVAALADADPSASVPLVQAFLRVPAVRATAA